MRYSIEKVHTVWKGSHFGWEYVEEEIAQFSTQEDLDTAFDMLVNETDEYEGLYVRVVEHGES